MSNGDGFSATTHIIIDVLDRMIDEGIENARTITALKHTVIESRNDLNRILGRLQTDLENEIKDHVSSEVEKINNSFKSELEDIKDTLEKLEPMIQNYDNIKRTQEEADKFFAKIKKPTTYLKLIVTLLIAFATFISGTAAVVLKISDMKYDESRQVENMPENNTLDD